MAVLIEGYSVIIKSAAADQKWPGGWSAFNEAIPNKTMCIDDYLIRVGFMNYNDVLAYCALLEENGLHEATETEEGEYVIVEQLRGPKTQPDWIDFGHVAHNRNPNQMLAACRYTGDEEKILTFPDGWKFEGSLSEKPNFVSNEEAKQRLEKIRRRDGVEVYYDKKTRKQVFVGRTSDDKK